MIESALDDLIDPAVGDIAGRTDWAEELAVDLMHTKGETYVVHRLFHALRAGGVACRLEDRRCDLVVEHRGCDVKIEAKAIHPHQLLSSSRADRGFEVLDRKTKDLQALKSGAADLLLAIVPRFRVGTHLKYPRQVGEHDLAAFGITEADGETTRVVGEATERAQEFASKQGISVMRRQLLELAEPGGCRVEVTLLWFGRSAADGS